MINTALMIPGTLPIGTVVLLGMGIVFLGLVCIVILCVLMGKVVRLLEKKEESSTPVAQAPAASASSAVAEIPNRGELVAAISCCLAEELGTDVSAIRILSLKKI